ncbi:hypothetical protein DFJ77DRAFT_466822 [Powellomyces hirtus]|nr:hypothetical protein DFJ77DRAFT_466822 [Powellomyces hirtus]
MEPSLDPSLVAPLSGIAGSSILVRRRKRRIEDDGSDQKAVGGGINDGVVQVATPSPYYGLYSGTGFDMMHILASVVSRPNPTINLGPIDMSSSFIVTSATDADFPILYASQTFEQLTGYKTAEIVGKNCRFLQSPDGIVQRGALRQFVDNNIVYQLKTSVDQQMECQFININYKKGGEPFVNLITIIPICNGGRRGTPPQFFVGFQVDLMKQAGVILRMLEDHTYVIDFAKSPQHQQQQQCQGIAGGDIPPLLLADCAPPCGSFEQEVQNPVGAPVATAAGAGAGAAAAGEDDDDLFQSLMMTTLPHQQHDRHQQQQQQQQQQELFASLNSTADYMRTDVMNIGGVGERATGILAAEECTRHDDDDNDDDDNNLRAAFASAIDHPAPPLSTATHIPTPPTSTASSTAACSSSSTPTTATPPDPISHYDLIQASPDFIHILSSRGIILFASPSSILTQTGYEPGDLLGHTIAEFCHPADTMLLMREIKQSTLEHPLSAAYRFRKRDGSGYVSWDVAGHKYEMATRKKTRCVVLSARERRWGDIKQSTLIPSLSPCSPPTRASTLASIPPTTTPLGGGTLPRALWCKITSTGLFIYVPPSSYPVFGSLTAPPSLYGRQLLDFVYEGDRARVAAQLFRNDDPGSGDNENTNESANRMMMMTKEIRCSIESAGRFVPALLAAHPSGAGDFMFLCVTLVGSITLRGGVTAVGGGEPSRPESSPTSPSAQPPTAPTGIHHHPTRDTTHRDREHETATAAAADVSVYANAAGPGPTSVQCEINQLRLGNKRLKAELEMLKTV